LIGRKLTTHKIRRRKTGIEAQINNDGEGSNPRNHPNRGARIITVEDDGTMTESRFLGRHR